MPLLKIDAQLPEGMVMAFFLIIIFVQFACAEIYSRLVFTNIAYTRRHGHGKSAGRAVKHYKTHWSFWERLTWQPVFKESYEKKCRSMAYHSYCHFFIKIVTAVWSCVIVHLTCDGRDMGKSMLYPTLVYGIAFCARMIYSESIATSKSFRRKNGRKR